MPRRPPSPLPQVAALTAYVPGRPSPSEAGSLASNESPFGASPAVQAALAGAAARIHRYPDPLAAELCAELARLHGVGPDNVLVANGSDEVIYLLVMAYAAGGRAVCADPPYRLDDIVPQIMGGYGRQGAAQGLGARPGGDGRRGGRHRLRRQSPQPHGNDRLPGGAAATSPSAARPGSSSSTRRTSTSPTTRRPPAWSARPAATWW